jgi:putative redox protein
MFVMITATGQGGTLRTVVGNGAHQLAADAPVAKGGEGAGFGAHQLLEASLAACISMAVRMDAAAKGLALQAVTVTVSLTHPNEETIRFEYQLRVTGDLTDADRAGLDHAAQQCPVRSTLSKTLQFAPR